MKIAVLNPTHDKSLWLDVARGLAALAVCCSHIRNALYVDHAQVTNAHWWHVFFYFFTGLGHQAVVVFFVLSGFLVGGSVVRDMAGFNLATYFVKRLCRLWTVLLPALLLTWLADGVTIYVRPAIVDGAFREVWNSGPMAGEYRADLLTFLGNAVFVQTILCPVFGTNSPLWSLANEFWYYLWFPAILICLGVIRSSIMVRCLCGLVMTVSLWLAPVSWLWGFGVWLMGVISARAASKIRSLSFLGGFALLVAAFQFGGVLCIVKFARHLSDAAADLMVGVSFSFVILGMFGAPFGSVRSRWVEIVVTHLARISYTLYVVHFPLLILLIAFWPMLVGLQPSFENGLFFVAPLVALMLVATIWWWLFERNTDRIRRLILCMLQPTAL